MRLVATSRAVILAGLVFFMGSARALAATDCVGPLMQVATVPTLQTTTSTTLRNLPGARVTNGMSGCIRVQFSAQVRAKSPGGLRIQLVRNGSPAGFPATADVRTSGDGYDTRTVTFIVRNVPAGDHTLQIRFASTDGRAARVSKVVLTVWYDSSA
jgi:hypothetical protein